MRGGLDEVHAGHSVALRERNMREGKAGVEVRRTGAASTCCSSDAQDVPTGLLSGARELSAVLGCDVTSLGEE